MYDGDMNRVTFIRVRLVRHTALSRDRYTRHIRNKVLAKRPAQRDMSSEASPVKPKVIQSCSSSPCQTSRTTDEAYISEPLASLCPKAHDYYSTTLVHAMVRREGGMTRKYLSFLFQRKPR